MPMPRFIARINKRLLNPRAIKKGKYPVITHVGRSSGKTYQTPLDAYPVENGFIFIPIYGANTDWVLNVRSAGTAKLTIDGNTIDLVSPRLIPAEQAQHLLPPGTKPPPEFLHVTDYLQMDIAA